MFTLQTSLKPLLLGGVKTFVPITPRIWLLDYRKGQYMDLWAEEKRHRDVLAETGLAGRNNEWL
jgi:hypothetical protein